MVLSTEDKRFLDEILERSRGLESPMMFLLHSLQDEFRYVGREHVEYLGKSMKRPISEIYSAATFYEKFNTEPVGRHVVRVCRGIVCHSRYSRELLESVKARLGIKDGETTEDGMFTLEEASCIGQCDGGPAMMIDGKVYRNVDPTMAVSILDEISEEGGD
jgi:NADH-quinone oxidoreductase subunit E